MAAHNYITTQTNDLHFRQSETNNNYSWRDKYV